MAPRDWAAATYHRVSAPHQDWADALLDRLAPRGDETVLDAGCGSGRVTRKLLDRLPDGKVIAVDGAPSMIAQARETLAGDPRVTVLEQNLVELVAPEPVEIVFSSAVFHWIADHPTLFARLAAALRPDGRLVAQCGGAGNLDEFRRRVDEIARPGTYAPDLADFIPPWNYAGPEETEERLRAAGFAEARAWLQPWPVTPPEPADYVRVVVLAPYLDHLPPERHDPFVDDVLEAAGDPLVLDYVRLNIDGRVPA